MSDKRSTFLDRIKDCIAYLGWSRNHKGALMKCDVCGSTNIQIDKTEVTGHSSYSEYTCLNCGSSCEAHQEWCHYD